MPDGRAETSPQNGLLGGGQPGPRLQTRVRAELIQKHAELDAETVIEQIARGALFDIGDLYDENGDLRPLHSLTEAQRQMIQGIEVVMKNAAAGDGKIDRVLKIKLADRAKYVEMAAKYHSLFIEQVKISGEPELIAALLSGRQRAAAKKAGPA